MSYPPNQLGIYDLGGNVANWCDAWTDEKRNSRVARGGSFDDFGDKTRSSYRWVVPITFSSELIGFRCVVELPGP